MILSNLTARMSTADPAPAQVSFVAVRCGAEKHVGRDRIAGTGTEEPAAYGSPGKRGRDGLPDPSSR